MPGYANASRCGKSDFLLLGLEHKIIFNRKNHKKVKGAVGNRIKSNKGPSIFAGETKRLQHVIFHLAKTGRPCI